MKYGIRAFCGVTVFSLLTVLFFSSCNKSNSDYTPQGGQLPTKYVAIRDTAIVPAILTMSVGNSITFLNQTSQPKSVESQDSFTFLTGPIAPGGTFFWKKDTTGTFDIHLTENPAIQSTIVIVP